MGEASKISLCILALHGHRALGKPLCEAHTRLLPPATSFDSVFLEGVPLQQLIIAEGWARIKGASLQDEDMVALQVAW
eukprot:scaffold148861_cov28-Tisochrysis_lutea.AAC.2